MGLDASVLVLNRIWQAVNVIHGRRAIALLYVGRGKAVDEEYSAHGWDSWVARSEGGEPAEETVTTVSGPLRVPRVIQLLDYDRVPRPRVKFTRTNVYLRDRHRCQYCGRQESPSDLTLDHVHPRSRGGQTSWGNIVVSCFRCNAKKADRLPEEAGMALLSEPRQPAWHPASVFRRVEHLHPQWQPFLPSAPR
jgi:5-methylcytosine-specific restriction endonuclease McrA